MLLRGLITYNNMTAVYYIYTEMLAVSRPTNVIGRPTEQSDFCSDRCFSF